MSRCPEAHRIDAPAGDSLSRIDPKSGQTNSQELPRCQAVTIFLGVIIGPDDFVDRLRVFIALNRAVRTNCRLDPNKPHRWPCHRLMRIIRIAPFAGIVCLRMPWIVVHSSGSDQDGIVLPPELDRHLAEKLGAKV